MKKIILTMFGMLLIPVGLAVLFSLFSDQIRIGTGGMNIKNHLLGKEILIEMSGLYQSMDVEEYVLGVLPGTIPADYDPEALKVQAVLIRTNILKEMQEKNTEDAADLSYQYLTVEERIAMWGERNYDNYEKRMEAAVVETAGMVIEQEGNLITAFYHEVSIGKTASAAEVLENDISYLQSVESNQDVEAKHYMNIIPYTWEEITEKQGDQNTETNVSEHAAQVDESTENGFVKSFSVDGISYTGEEAMQIFQLSSTNFYVEMVEGGFRFICLGKGNCLGVSQYGANAMAQNGSSMEEIISYYYQGVSLVNLHTT